MAFDGGEDGIGRQVARFGEAGSGEQAGGSGDSAERGAAIDGRGFRHGVQWVFVIGLPFKRERRPGGAG